MHGFIDTTDIDNQRHLIPVAGIKRATPDGAHDGTYLNVEGYGPIILPMSYDAFIQLLIKTDCATVAQ